MQNHNDKSCGRIFFFQAEDGIRDVAVTGVQTCALPISNVDKNVYSTSSVALEENGAIGDIVKFGNITTTPEIGRASCRERV